jgi:multiple sugar transport system substrate-binding protein
VILLLVILKKGAVTIRPMKLFASSMTIFVLTVFVSVYVQNNYYEMVFGQQQVKLTAIVAEPKERWDILFEKSLDKLRQNHPELDIHP